MHFPIDRLSGLGRSGARADVARGAVASTSRRHPYPGVIERVLPNALRAAVSRGVPLCLSSSIIGGFGLVNGAVAQHGEQHVAAT
ncbi:hypothetical protein ACGYRZ_12740, partial [Burkholderia pseudomallei]